MEVLVEMALGQGPICIWVFAANITDEFILGPDIIYAHDASVEFRCHVLQLGNKEMSLRHTGAQPLSTPCMNGNSEVAAVQ
jgi:hypothetical protein